MFTIKHYGMNGYDVYEAASYSVMQPPCPQETSITPSEPMVYLLYTPSYSHAEMKDPQQAQTIVISGSSHAYVTNAAGKTVDHIRSVMNIPTGDGFVTALR